MKMPERIDTELFAPCGMNCKVCYRHCFHKTPCAGCRKDDVGKPEHCRRCRIKDCVQAKGLTHCFACAAYPCIPLSRLEKSYRQRYQASLMENSAYVREYGLEAFMTWQRERYTCKICGGVLSLHDQMCSECRAKDVGPL